MTVRTTNFPVYTYLLATLAYFLIFYELFIYVCECAAAVIEKVLLLVFCTLLNMIFLWFC